MAYTLRSSVLEPQPREVHPLLRPSARETFIEIALFRGYEETVCCILDSEDRASRHRRQDVMPDPEVAASRRPRTNGMSASARLRPLRRLEIPVFSAISHNADPRME
jgi:hypothetical protein